MLFKKLIWSLLVSFAVLSGNVAEAVIPFPARIGGTVTINGAQLTQTTAAGYTFAVTKQDGSGHVPAAEDLNGLNVFELMGEPAAH